MSAPKKTSVSIAIVGGGAAGFFAAIHCKMNNLNADVTIIEQGKEVLQKVRISGGGRCNVTNGCFDPKELAKHYPRGSRELIGPFHTFCSGDTFGWFEDRGVTLKIESDGRVFPTSNNSQAIIDCLTSEVHRLGIEVKTSFKVQQLDCIAGKWQINKALVFDKLMIAAGSSKVVWNLLEGLGHTVVKPVPSLFTFNIQDARIKDLPGISVPNAQVKVLEEKLESEGPLLITHWGMSGPAILKLSAWGARALHHKEYKFQIQINWLGHREHSDVLDELLQAKAERPKQLVIRQNPFDLPKRLWESFVKVAGIQDSLNWADVSKKGLHQLCNELTRSEYTVNGKSTFKEEFVTAGGVDLKEVDLKHFKSKLLPNLYMAGEIINIDAITGGFNFQAAWTGGYIAGLSMAE